MTTEARAASPLETYDIDREIVLTRVLPASRARVWAAWSDADQLGVWFGPKGFTCRVHAFDFRVGGSWRFDLVAPDGTVFDNRMTYLEITHERRIVADHGHDVDDDPTRFRVTVTFDEQSDGKTVLTLRQLHPTAEQRANGIGFGAVELGLQTLAKLEAIVTAS